VKIRDMISSSTKVFANESSISRRRCIGLRTATSSLLAHGRPNRSSENDERHNYAGKRATEHFRAWIKARDNTHARPKSPTENFVSGETVNTADILTERLKLVAITPKMLETESTDRGALSRILDANVPSLWPPEHREPHVLNFIQQQCCDAPDTLGWHRYVVLHGQPATLIGTLGAFLRGRAVAEVGYSILQPWRYTGFATEGLRALIAELLKDNQLESIVAQSFLKLVPSSRVMEKCGLSPDGPGDDEGSVR
jgi:[ribosomal protein S5]-alanine N-acetyltransferase